MKINAGLFVVLASIIFPITLVVTYSISLYNKHIIPIWPYISHTGDDPNESCFFSLGINIVAGLYAFVVFLRYAQVKDFFTSSPSRTRTFLNSSSLFWGILASLSLSTTSSFQQRNISLVHVISAVICSYAALVYFWHQTLFCYAFKNLVARKTKIFRTVLSLISTIIHGVAPCLYMYTLIKHPMPEGKVTQWANTDEKSMGIYLAGSFMEWSVFLCNELYVASFYCEFRRIRFRIGELVFVKDDEPTAG